MFCKTEKRKSGIAPAFPLKRSALLVVLLLILVLILLVLLLILLLIVLLVLILVLLLIFMLILHGFSFFSFSFIQPHGRS